MSLYPLTEALPEIDPLAARIELLGTDMGDRVLYTCPGSPWTSWSTKGLVTLAGALMVGSPRVLITRLRHERFFGGLPCSE